MSRVGALLLISGILFVGLRQAYRELSQQNEVGGDNVQLQMNGDAPGNGELMKKVGMFKSVTCLLHSNQTTRYYYLTVSKIINTNVTLLMFICCEEQNMAQLLILS